MKIWCISDTHGHHRRLHATPEVDVVVHRGDLCQFVNAVEPRVIEILTDMETK